MAARRATIGQAATAGSTFVVTSQVLVHNNSAVPHDLDEARLSRLAELAFPEDSSQAIGERLERWKTVQLAFADPANPLRFGLEGETPDLDKLSAYYRPPWVDDSSWANMSLEDRELEAGSFLKWQKREQAPGFLAEGLTRDNSRPPSNPARGSQPVAEIALREPLETFEGLLQAASWSARELADVNFHHHLTFMMNPERAELVAHAFAAASDNVWLRLIAEDPVWVGDGTYGPRTSESVREMAGLLAGEGSFPALNVPDSFPRPAQDVRLLVERFGLPNTEDVRDWLRMTRNQEVRAVLAARRKPGQAGVDVDYVDPEDAFTPVPAYATIQPGPWPAEVIPQDGYVRVVSDISSAQKSFGFSVRGGRWGPYKSWRLFGGELRGDRWYLPGAARRLDNLVTFLAGPERGQLAFGVQAPRYGPDALREIPRLNLDVPPPALSAQTLDYLERLFPVPDEAGRRLIPLVPWHQLPTLTRGERLRVEELTVGFVRRLSNRAQQFGPAADDLGREQSWVDKLVHQWARDTQIAERF